MDLIERQVADQVRRHPWEIARADFYLGVLRRFGVLRDTVRCLDAGAGDAWFAGRLRGVLPESCELVCWDPNYTPEDLAPSDAGDDIVRTAERPPGRFDGILLLDVIEHVEDDRGFLDELVEHSLADGGWVLVGVPAYQALFSAHDRALRHHRRYSPRQLRAVLAGAGLRPVASGGLFHGLLPLRAVQVVLERRGRRAVSGDGVGDWHGSPRRTRALASLLRLEGRLSLGLASRRLGVVPGLSTWALCRQTKETGR